MAIDPQADRMIHEADQLSKAEGIPFEEAMQIVKQPRQADGRPTMPSRFAKAVSKATQKGISFDEATRKLAKKAAKAKRKAKR